MSNIHQEITDRIIAQLEKGVVPWVRPWSETSGENIPRNVVSGNAYNGTNKLLLWIEMQARADWTLPRFLTFKQARDAGGTVKGGEHGVRIVKLGTGKIKEPKDGDRDSFSFLKTYTVFNVAQCDGLPAKFTDPVVSVIRNHSERDPVIDDFVKTTGVRIVEDDKDYGGTEAFYQPSGDYVHMPLFSSFDSADKFYDTLFHELIHATGAKHRLNRDLSGNKHSSTYAFEELIAELGGAFCCAEFSIDVIRHNASYIASWLKHLKNDNRMIFKAASAAQKAVDFFRGIALQDEQQEAA